jgi:hypothetical protein
MLDAYARCDKTRSDKIILFNKTKSHKHTRAKLFKYQKKQLWRGRGVPCSRHLISMNRLIQYANKMYYYMYIFYSSREKKS